MESKENLDISSSSGLDIAPLVYETYYNRIGATEVAPPTPRFALAAQREREREREGERERATGTAEGAREISYGGEG